MIKLTRIMIAATATCSAIYGAHAADLSQPPRVLSYPTPVPEASASGWYLRGDIGVGLVYDQSLYDSYIASPGANTTAGWLNRSIDDSVNIDVGVGYQFTNNLRGDVTLQYRTATAFQGANYITTTTTNNGNTTTTTGQNVATGSVSSIVGLVNGYYDIGRWNGLEPYIGAGIGVAYNHISATSSQQGYSQTDYGVFDSKGQANFAWALHTGLAYEINSRLKLELGYSFLSLGDSKSGNERCYNGGCGGGSYVNEYLKVKGLYSNDFHLGVRWLFDVADSGYSQASYQSSGYQQSSSWQQPAATYEPPATTYQQQQTTTYQAPYRSSYQTTYPAGNQGSYPTAYPPSSAPVVARY